MIAIAASVEVAAAIVFIFFAATVSYLSYVNIVNIDKRDGGLRYPQNEKQTTNKCW